MHVFIAGAGGPLGRQLIEQFLSRGLKVTAMAYSLREFEGLHHPRLKTLACDVTKPSSLEGVCRGADLVISCLGITRMKNKLTHMDVDYQGNLNLLREAEASGVRKFAIITPIGAEHGHAHNVPLLSAKHLFKQELRKSALQWVIFRCGGFFPDLAAMGKAARQGPLILVGSGKNVFTPVDVRDVAAIMAEDVLAKANTVVEIGGPEVMSWNAICETCFAHYGRPARILHVPIWVCRAILPIVKLFSPAFHAMGELIVFMSSHDLPTPTRGARRFKDYLAEVDPV